ncbi:hypothetical protein [Lysobacter brunescens]|uniref:Uncharacterized protein n=1 Tax=Lysobacter brunescens TaxID=262323 RepID=A0ABW2YI24_9GAMM
MKLPHELAAVLLVLFAIMFGWRAWSAIREGCIGWGANDKAVYIDRRQNPGAFWFFFSFFLFFSLGCAYGAYSSAAGFRSLG